MVVKNVEAPTARTARASVSNDSSEGNIDMNIVAKSDYNFQGFAFNPVTEGGSIWFNVISLGIDTSNNSDWTESIG